MGVGTGELGGQADCAGAIHPSLGQGDTGCLPQAPGQLAGLLHQHVSGDDRQVEGQQLVALDRLRWVALAVIAQELPGGGEERTGLRGRATARHWLFPAPCRYRHLTRPQHPGQRGLPHPLLA